MGRWRLPHALYRAGQAALLGLLAAPAPAHEIMSSWTTVRLEPDRLELTTKIAAEAVWPAVQTEAPEAIFEVERVEELRPLLERCARRLHELTAAGRPLLATRAEVKVVEDYLEFRVAYPRPAPGVVRVEARYLARMSPEFEANFSVVQAGGAVLLSRTLDRQQPSLELPWPQRSAAVPKKAAAPSPPR